MIFVLGLISIGILFTLSILHFHWALGGSYGFDNSLPTNEEGERVLNPKKIDSGIVGFGLLIFALIYLARIGLIDFQLPSFVMEYGLWLIVLIFTLRSIGDFKYVGFFKKVRTTEFTKMDTKLYAPLCLFLALIGLMIEFTELDIL